MIYSVDLFVAMGLAIKSNRATKLIHTSQQKRIWKKTGRLITTPECPVQMVNGFMGIQPQLVKALQEYSNETSVGPTESKYIFKSDAPSSPQNDRTTLKNLTMDKKLQRRPKQSKHGYLVRHHYLIGRLYNLSALVTQSSLLLESSCTAVF